MIKIHTELVFAVMAVLLAGNVIAEEKHKHSFSKDVDALHDVLAPLWHAPKSKERSQNVCAQSGKLATLAKEINSGDPKELQTSIADLQAQCKVNPSDIDAAFSLVHDAFHHLTEHKEH